MSRYYANITGAANVTTNFAPYSNYTGNGNYLRLEYVGDITTTATTDVYVWRQQGAGNNWFSFEQGSFKQYMNIGSTTYVGGMNNDASKRFDWDTTDLNNPTIFTLSDGTATYKLGTQEISGGYYGAFTNYNLLFFPTTQANNLQMVFYELKVYGANNTLLFDFVPDYSGATKGIRDLVSESFFSASDQSKIELVNLVVFDVDTSAITGTYAASSYTVSLEAEEGMSWTASTNDSWISVSPLSGTGSATLTISLQKNNTYTGRTGMVEITNGEDTIEITCSQPKHPVLVPKNNIYREGDLIN